MPENSRGLMSAYYLSSETFSPLGYFMSEQIFCDHFYSRFVFYMTCLDTVGCKWEVGLC